MLQTRKLATINEQAIIDYAREKNFAKIYEISFHNSGLIAISNLQKCTKLKVLDLSSNSISVIENLQSNTELKELILFQNEISQIQNLEKQVELESLGLQFNKISTIAGLKPLRKLKSLRLDGNAIKVIENLDGCKALTSLDLSSNQIEKIQGLDAMISLNELNLSFNKIRRIEGIQPVKASLSELQLQYNKLETLDGFISCEQLRILRLQGNGLTSLASLPKLPLLEELNVSQNSLTNLIDLSEKAPSLEIIDLSDNKFESLDLLCNALVRLTKLTDLDAGGNPFMVDDGTLKSIAQSLTQIVRLNGKQLMRESDTVDILQLTEEEPGDPYYRKPVLPLEMDEAIERIMRSNALLPFGERSNSSLDYMSLSSMSRPSTGSGRPTTSASRPLTPSSRPGSASGRKAPVMKPMTAHMNSTLKLKPVEQYEAVKVLCHSTKDKIDNAFQQALKKHTSRYKEAWTEDGDLQIIAVDEIDQKIHAELVSVLKETLAETAPELGPNPYRARLMQVRSRQERNRVQTRIAARKAHRETRNAQPSSPSATRPTSSTSSSQNPSSRTLDDGQVQSPSGTSKRQSRRMQDAMKFSKRYSSEDIPLSKLIDPTPEIANKEDITSEYRASPIHPQGTHSQRSASPDISPRQMPSFARKSSSPTSPAGNTETEQNNQRKVSWTGRSAERQPPPSEQQRQVYTHFKTPSSASLHDSISIDDNLQKSTDLESRPSTRQSRASDVSESDDRPATPTSARAWWNATNMPVARPITPTHAGEHKQSAASSNAPAASNILRVDPSRMAVNQSAPESRPKSPVIHAKKLPTAKGGLAPRKATGK
eukprot:TRINITY_DN5645_c0_g1_i1.p1 TRINITY_DN5645_c0_g1~~TRINITY_DN5645_c0_g1_i1.p1  ORF type:complete len:825 (+),score=168.13 TRINITY_DN5645_c0_g1_i1:193-2667(+)